MSCYQDDFFKSRVEPLDCYRSELCIVSAVIYRFVEFDTSVIGNLHDGVI